MDWEQYQTSGQFYADNMNKMLAKMAVCERYLPVVTINGQETKLTNVYNRPSTGNIHGARELVFIFQSMDTTIQPDHTQTLCPTGGSIVSILQIPASDWQSNEAKRIHDAVHEQYQLHG